MPQNKEHNLPSALLHPDVVNDKLQAELQLGRIAGPFSEPPFPDLVISPIGVVPKKRLIHHLSYPRGESINSGIDKFYTSVSYHNVDQAIDLLCNLGSGSYMAKTDIQSAFRIIPVHPSNYKLLGFTWKNQFYYDRMLAMGLSASCQIFEAFSSSLQWIAHSYLDIEDMLHILDDFLIMATTESQCSLQLQGFTDLCNEIGVPLAPEKNRGSVDTAFLRGHQTR